LEILMTDKRRSVTFTALIFFGMVIALVGLILAALGLGGVSTFEFAVGDFTLKTTSVGLAVLAVGVGLSAGVALNLPENVELFGPTERTMTERLRGLAPAFVLTALGSLIAFVVTVVVL
jgi:hypothetical protein